MTRTDVHRHLVSPPWGAVDDAPTTQFRLFGPAAPVWPTTDPDEHVLVAGARQALRHTRPPTVAVLEDVLAGLYRLL